MNAFREGLSRSIGLAVQPVSRRYMIASSSKAVMNTRACIQDRLADKRSFALSRPLFIEGESSKEAEGSGREAVEAQEKAAPPSSSPTASSSPSSSSSSSSYPSTPPPSSSSSPAEEKIDVWNALLQSIQQQSSSEADASFSSRRTGSSATTTSATTHDERISLMEARDKLWLNRKKWGGNHPGKNWYGKVANVNARNPNGFRVAFLSLQQLLRKDNIQKEYRLRQRYEKPTDKRRRLKREAHRERFARLVREKVQLVMHLRNRGAS